MADPRCTLIATSYRNNKLHINISDGAPVKNQSRQNGPSTLATTGANAALQITGNAGPWSGIVF
jgi:hypothetical protein